MLNINKTYFILFCTLIISQVVSVTIITNLDELLTVALLGLGFLDMIYNRKIKQYIPIIVPLSILTLYLLYSLFFCHFNTTKPIIADFFQHLKVFVFFGVAYAIAPKFDKQQKKIIKFLLLIELILGLAIYSTLLFGRTIYYDIFLNPYFIGRIFLSATLTYLLFIDSNNWKLVKKNLFALLLLATIGLTCGRSKYYGTFIFILFIITIYQPGKFAKITLKNVILIASLTSISLIVAWNKIQFYFLNAELATNNFDEETLNSFARPALYVGMVLILIDYPLLGSGFASFGTVPSGPEYNYSSLYEQYGLNNVWGLSIEKSDFIADAFYPGLAQFGLIGIVLFILCLVWLYKKLKLVHRYNGIVPYIIGVIIIIAILIDSTSSRGITSLFGEYLFSIMGIILAPIAKLSKEEQKELIKQEVTGTSIWNRIFNRKNKEKLIYGK